MSSPRLQAYLALERSMLQLDELDDSLADKLRDAMDPVWYALTDEERAMLNSRDAGHLDDGVAKGTSNARFTQTSGVSPPGLASWMTRVEPSTTSGTTFRADLRAA